MVELSTDFLVEHVAESLREDLGDGDVTTQKALKTNPVYRGEFQSRESGVQAGRPVLEVLFELLPDFVEGESRLQLDWNLEDGEEFAAGAVLGSVRGPVENLLAAERVALNYLQQLSGVATKTRRIVETVDDSEVEVFDTRKTTPHLRQLQKYAVSVGGGNNHRLDLSGAIMVKDNHKLVAGGLRKTLENIDSDRTLIVEIHSPEELREIRNFDIDVVMLDNMEPEKAKEILPGIPEEVAVEVSGGIDRDNAREYAETGVDRISLGSLTHSFDSLDISFGLIEDA